MSLNSVGARPVYQGGTSFFRHFLAFYLQDTFFFLFLHTDMSSRECIDRFSKILFWDIDLNEADMDKYPAHFIQRVLEYGSMDDWRLLRSYYGLPKIVEECKQLCTLDPVCLSYICAISHTNPKEYRCYQTHEVLDTM